VLPITDTQQGGLQNASSVAERSRNISDRVLSSAAMPIPTYEQMLRPILALAAEKDISRRSAAAAMEEHFRLTPDERAARIPSGSSTYVENRNGWAMTFLTKAGLIAKVAPRTYRITEFGRKYLTEHLTEITERDLRTIPGWKEAWNTAKRKEEPPGGVTTGKTPIEALDEAIATINADVKSRVLAAILDQSPSFFEELVLDVLQAMGYGGSREDAAQHLGRSGDEGIDGRINQDPLGLDQILIQAKRYAPENIINRQTIQAFVGSMTGQGVSKGIFITTSSFNETPESLSSVDSTRRSC
jgi:restriction system protein